MVLLPNDIAWIPAETDPNFSVSRNNAATAPDGTAVAANQPIYMPQHAVYEFDPTTTNGPDLSAVAAGAWYIIGVGYAANGRPMVAFYNADNAKLTLYYAEPWALVSTVSAGWSDGGPTFDLLKGDANENALFRHRPYKVEIINGVVVAACTVEYDTDGEASWSNDYECVLYSTDNMATWSFVQHKTGESAGADDLANYPEPTASSSDLSRGAVWCFGHRPYTVGEWPVQRVMFGWSDYIANPGSPGGWCRRFDMYFDADGTFSSCGKTVKVSTNARNTSDGAYTSGRHAHALVFLGDRSMVALYGDGEQQIVERITLDDYDAYESATLTVKDDFSGSGDAPAEVGTSQTAGFAMDVNGDCVMLPDNVPPAVFRVETPATADSKMTLTPLMYHLLPRDVGSEGLWLQHWKPGLDDSGYIGYIIPNSSGGLSFPTTTRRIIYSDNGIDWSVLQASTAIAPTTKRYFIVGGSIVYISGNAQVVTMKRPTRKRMVRPVLLSEGGTDQHDDSYTVANYNGGVAAACSRDVGGNVLYPASYPVVAKRGTALEVQPPVDHDVFYCQQPPGTNITIISVDGKASIPTGQQRIQMLAWTPANRTQMVTRIGTTGGAPDGASADFQWNVSICNHAEWMPVSLTRATTGPFTFRFYGGCGYGTLQWTNSEYFFTFASHICETAGDCIYTAPKGTATLNANTGTVALSGFGANWTLGSNFILPFGYGGNNSWWQRQAIADIALLKFGLDADNHAVLNYEVGAAHNAAGDIELIITAGGSEVDRLNFAGIWPQNDDPISLVMAYDGTTLSATLQMAGVNYTDSGAVDWTAVSPTSITNQSATIGYGETYINRHVAYDDDQRAEALIRLAGGPIHHPSSRIMPASGIAFM